MRRSRELRRKLFLERMSKEAMASYEDSYRDWYGSEKEFLPIFLSLVGGGRHIMDLAGGCGKAVPDLLNDGNSVVLADLSLHSLKDARATLAPGDVEFARLDMLAELPFVDDTFDGIWFAEAFEYIPPDARLRFLRAMRRIVKDGGVVFLSAEGLSAERTWFMYVKNYLYWKLVKRAPVVWGEYIYMLDLPAYKGWHYHSLVLSRRIERTLQSAGFEVVRREGFGKTEYASYILKAV